MDRRTLMRIRRILAAVALGLFVAAGAAAPTVYHDISTPASVDVYHDI